MPQTKLLRLLVSSFLVLASLFCSRGLRAEVKPTSGEYYETHVDLEVKVLGGYIRAKRSWVHGRWHYNRVWNDLKFQYDDADGSLISVDRNGDIFTPANGRQDLFVFGKRRTITVRDDGFLWQDRRGNWIKFDKMGRLLSYGDRNDITVSMRYDSEGNRTGVYDHHGNQALWYQYDGEHPVVVRDRTGRRVEYRRENDLLRTVVDVLGHEWHYDYDAQGRVIERLDPEDHGTHITYDAMSRVRRVKDDDGIGLSYQYDYDRAAREMYIRVESSGGRIEEAWFSEGGLLRRYAINDQTLLTFHTDGQKTIHTDRNGNRTVFTFDSANNLVDRVDALGYRYHAEYDPVYSNIVREVNEKGVATAYNYDERGNLTSMVEAVGTRHERTTHYGYDEFVSHTTTSSPRDDDTQNVKWAYKYDDYGNVIQITDPARNTAQFTYDVMGNVLTETDERGKLWKNTYDNAGNLVSESDPLGDGIRYEYDNVGNLVTQTDAEVNLTRYEYNQYNRLVKVVDTAGNITRYAHNADQKLTGVTDQEGKSRRFEYAPDNRMTALIDGTGNAVHLGYGDNGELGSGTFDQPVHIRHTRYQLQFDFNSHNDLVSETLVANDGSVLDRKFAYDAVGNLTSETDWDGKTSSFFYDAFDNEVRQTNALGLVATASYDKWDNLISLTDNAGNSTRVTYDTNDRLIKITRPMGQEATYTYDQAGNLLQVIDAKRQKIEYTYDDAGRRTEARYYLAENDKSPQRKIAYSYDSHGNVTAWKDATASATYTYDVMQSLTGATVDCGDFSLSYQYTYYKNGLKKTFTGPDDVSYEYSYDANNDLVAIRIPGLGAITVELYQRGRVAIGVPRPGGNTVETYQVGVAPLNTTVPGGVATHYSYDELLNVERIQVKDPAQHVIADLKYSYTKLGQVRTKATSSGSYTYDYDKADRLVLATHSQWGTEQFKLDGLGNVVATATVSQWRYNANNELLRQGDTRYEYDANGNLIRKTIGTSGRRFFYDIANRLVRVEDGTGAIIARYGYDPFGQRLWKEVGGRRTYFFYSEEGLVGEYDATGKQLRAYGYRPDGIWGTNPLFLRNGEEYFFYHNDDLGTPHFLTGLSGALDWSAHYSAFGAAHGHAESHIINNLRLPGQYYDAETGLHYNLHRYYDPQTGRYMTPDPLGLEGGLNCYAYADGDPINSIDPYGLTAWDVVDPVFCGKSLLEYCAAPGFGTGFWAALDCIAAALPVIPSTRWFRGAGHTPPVSRMASPRSRRPLRPRGQPRAWADNPDLAVLSDLLQQEGLAASAVRSVRRAEQLVKKLRRRVRRGLTSREKLRQAEELLERAREAAGSSPPPPPPRRRGGGWRLDD